MSVGLHKQQFAYVKPDRQQYFMEENLLGIAMPCPLPDAEPDILDAANCLALELHTAAVFHLMRVAEHGVRKLIKDLNVTLPNRPSLDDSDWSELVTALTAKVLSLGTPKRGSPDVKEIDRLNALVSEARMLKEFRNPTMHCGRRYNEHEAANILGHVRHFMQRAT
jgi:DNA-binding PucR family transcriptional regulator